MKNSLKVLVINLDRDTERMRFMDEQLASLRIPYERFSAIDPREQEVGNEYSEELAQKKGKHLLLPGELGCAVSHKRTYQHFLESSAEYALILEDDVLLPDNFKQVIQDEIHKKHSWEYLLFDYPEVGVSFIKKWFRSIAVNFKTAKKKGLLFSLFFTFYSFIKGFYIIPMSLFEGVRNFYKRFSSGPVIFLRPVYFAGAYLVTRKGAEKLLSLTSPIRYTADKLPNQARMQKGLIFRVYAPLIVQQLKKRFGSSLLGVAGDKL